MAYAYIQTVDFGNTGAASSIVTGSYTLTSGSRVIAVACYASGSDLVTTITDTNGNTWNKIGTGEAGGVSGMYYNLFECKNVTVAGSTQITVNLSSSVTQRGIAGMEVSGLHTSDAVQDSNYNFLTAPGTGTDAITSGTITPTSQPALVFAFAQDSGNSDPITAGTGFTFYACPNCSVINGSSQTYVGEKRVTSTSATAATGTTAFGSHSFEAIGAIVAEATGGGSIGFDDGDGPVFLVRVRPATTVRLV